MGTRKANSWARFITQYAQQHRMKLKHAMRDRNAKAAYHASRGMAGGRTRARSRGRSRSRSQSYY